ncbi:MAG TPA: hypothetical protein VN451_08510, partial [Chitinophagaceae bacterium]|nr:hypothetical protein [Chitinophagaceae bacterium]
MKKITSFFFLLIIANNLFAQEPCNDEIIMVVKGKWTINPEADMKAMNPQATIRLDKMQKILQAAYPEPKGMEARWYQPSTNTPLIENGPLPYQLTSGFFHYYCNQNVKKMRLGGETAVWFYVYANQFRWFLDEVKEYVIQNQPVYLLRKKAGEIKGYPVYEGNYNQKTNLGTFYSRAIILTRNGQLPWLPVSKKEFLTAYISLNEKRFQEALRQTEKNIIVRTDKQEEEYKIQQLAKIERTTSPDKVAKARDLFLRSYIPDKQQKASDITRMKQGHEEFMNPARLILSNSTDPALEQPAILDLTNTYQFKEFVTEEKGGMLVRLNQGYFDMKLPKYMPQFLVAYWTWDVGKPQNYWKEQIENNFDFDALK